MTEIDKAAVIAQALQLQTLAIKNYDQEKQYRQDLDTPPPRIAQLPIRRGYPVPWFVAKVDGEYDFRIADPQKKETALSDRICWACGQKMGRLVSIIIGPISLVTKVTADPGLHLDCAQWTSRNCPFLSNPTQMRREDAIMQDLMIGGSAVKRNPGVHAIWTTKTYRKIKTFSGPLVEFGHPESITWHSERRNATRAEVEASFNEGVLLIKERVPLDEMEDFNRQVENARQWLPDA